MGKTRMIRDRKQAKAHNTYIPRALALKRLQISLADFRRLCILKGIYPREPKKKLAGNDKTYYHAKDIKYLQHEPLLRKFFEIQTFMKKYKKLVGRKEMALAKRKEGHRPEYTLHHLVKERYPTFDDALRDLDDGLSMLALFQSLPATKMECIGADVVQECSQLYDEFQLYLTKTNGVRKVFASIKGYYFQAEVLGATVTWLAPHQFAQKLPEEVDFRVMLTFLEFYRTLLKFVNFKLFATSGWAYPPPKDLKADKGAARCAALKVEALGDSLSAASDFAETEEGAKMDASAKEAKKTARLFAKMKMFVSREVPFAPLLLLARCAGAEVGWQGAGSPFTAEDESVTHYIVDRPLEHLKLREGAEYVQPQWVLDSFNTKTRLPLLDYAPGKVPPPHLSPFVDDAEEGYVPEQREKLNELIGQGKAEDEEQEEAEEEEAEAVEQRFIEELKAEQSGVWHSEFEAAKAPAPAPERSYGLEPKVKPTKRQREEEEHDQRAKQLMSKKHKRLLQRIDYTKATKTAKNETLSAKRKAAEETQ